MRILMVGAGATGGFVGARLAQAGRDITFLVRPRRMEQIREHGLTLLSPLGDVTVHPKLLTAKELRTKGQPFNLILISTKAYQLEQAMEDIAPAVGPNTLLLPILNGMRQFDVLDARFGAEHVLGGSVRVVADVDAEGRIHQASKLSELSYGPRDGRQTPTVEAVHATLSDAGFDGILRPNILATLWQKWWILSSLGTICVLSRGSVGQAAAAPHGHALINTIIDECIMIAATNGYPPDPGMLSDHRKRMTEPGSTLTSSLYRDMMRGAAVEADHILGDLLHRANGVTAPLVTAAYVQLKVYEHGRVL